MTFSCRSSSTVLPTVFLNTMHELVICWGRCSGFNSVVLYWSFNKVSWLFPGAYPVLLFFVHLLQTSCIHTASAHKGSPFAMVSFGPRVGIVQGPLVQWWSLSLKAFRSAVLLVLNSRAGEYSTWSFNTILVPLCPMKQLHKTTFMEFASWAVAKVHSHETLPGLNTEGGCRSGWGSYFPNALISLFFLSVSLSWTIRISSEICQTFNRRNNMVPHFRADNLKNLFLLLDS